MNFSESEFFKMLETAKKAGAKRIEIQGFSLVFDDKMGPKIGAARPRNSPQKNSQGVENCEACGSRDMRPSQFKAGEFYCYDCYLDGQEKKWNSQKTWPRNDNR